MEERKVWLEKLQEDAEIPEIVYQKVELAFDRIRTVPNPTGARKMKVKTSGSRKKYAIFILAAVLMIGTLSVSAATYFH